MTVAVILAGGTGTRVIKDVAKQHIVINEHEIIEYTLTAFSNCESVGSIIVVSNVDYIDRVEAIKKYFTKLDRVVCGGKTRI